MAIRFSLASVTACVPEHEIGEEPVGMPADLLDVIGAAGDQFRDWFTRLCLYLVLNPGGGSAHHADGAGRNDDTVVIGTEYGNTAALIRLQRDAATAGRLLSAQYFPNATSSSASAYVSMGLGATGHNLTLNAGPLTPVIALWHALSALSRGRSGTSHLLVGDVYAEQAVQDAQLDQPGACCRSGVTYAALARGDDYSAGFGFGPAAGDPGNPAVRHPRDGERNGAFATVEFLRLIQGLGPAGHAALDCQAGEGRRATVTVTRLEPSARGAVQGSER